MKTPMLWAGLLLWSLPCIAQQNTAKPTLTYMKEIKPLLKERCVVCHNRDSVKNLALSGGLALDSFVALKTGLPNKPPLFVPGKSGSSELIRRLEVSSPALLMPKGGPALSKQQIALVKKWIDSGANPGDTSKEGDATAILIEPFPINSGLNDLLLSTRIVPLPEMRDKQTPQNATLQYALKVAPLPLLTSIVFSPDGKWLAVGTYRSVTIWDTHTGQPQTPITLLNSVQSLAFRPDGQVLAIGGGAAGVSGEVRLYDLVAKRLLPITFKGHTDILYCVAWNREGKLLATASHDKTARVWDATSGKELQALKEHSDAVTRVCFSPDSKSVYTASLDRNARRFGVQDGKVVRTFSGHAEAIYALALSPDGKRLVSSGIEPRLRWWNPEDGNTTNYSDGSSGQVNEIVFSADGKRLASVDASGRLRLWDAGGGGQQRVLEGANDWLYTVAISPDGKWVAGAGSEGVLYLWQTDSGALRLQCASWYPTAKGFDWVAITPEGYLDGSPNWLAKTRFRLQNRDLAPSLQVALRSALKASETILKALQGAPIEPYKLMPVPAPKAPLPKPKP